MQSGCGGQAAALTRAESLPAQGGHGPLAGLESDTVTVAEHLAHCTAQSPEAFVLQSSQGTHLRRSNFNRRVWQPAIRAAGVGGLLVHDLRHTAGTLATAADSHSASFAGRLLADDATRMSGRCVVPGGAEGI